ncbi:MAG: hypothetical protein V4481_05405 [Patescibacteria group bacterium]
MIDNKHIFARILLVILFLVGLLGPGIFFLYVGYLAYLSEGETGVIVPGVLGVIFICGGLAGIVANLRHRK